MQTKVTYNPYSTIITDGVFEFEGGVKLSITKTETGFDVKMDDGIVDIEQAMTTAEGNQLLLLIRNILVSV